MLTFSSPRYTAQGHNDESAETSSGLCVTYDTPATPSARNMHVTGDQQAPLSSSPCPIQPGEVEDRLPFCSNASRRPPFAKTKTWIKEEIEMVEYFVKLF